MKKHLPLDALIHQSVTCHLVQGIVKLDVFCAKSKQERSLFSRRNTQKALDYTSNVRVVSVSGKMRTLSIFWVFLFD